MRENKKHRIKEEKKAKKETEKEGRIGGKGIREREEEKHERPNFMSSEDLRDKAAHTAYERLL